MLRPCGLSVQLYLLLGRPLRAANGRNARWARPTQPRDGGRKITITSAICYPLGQRVVDFFNEDSVRCDDRSGRVVTVAQTDSYAVIEVVVNLDVARQTRSPRQTRSWSRQSQKNGYQQKKHQCQIPAWPEGKRTVYRTGDLGGAMTRLRNPSRTHCCLAGAIRLG